MYVDRIQSYDRALHIGYSLRTILMNFVPTGSQDTSYFLFLVFALHFIYFILSKDHRLILALPIL